jgi:hypothetical protein
MGGGQHPFSTKLGQNIMVRITQPLLSEKETEALSRMLDYLADEEKGYADLPPDQRDGHIFRSC